MKSMPTNREVIELIHQGLPSVPNSRPNAPDKKTIGRGLGKLIGQFSAIENHPMFQPTTEEIADVQKLVKEARSVRALIAGVRKRMMVPLEHMTVAFFLQQEQIMQKNTEAHHAFQSMKRMHWERYQEVRNSAAEDLRTENAGSSEEELARLAYLQVIFGGVHNYVYSDLAPLLCIPQIVEETEKIVVGPERWNAIGDSTLAMIKDMSHSQDFVFIDGISPAMKEKNAKPIPKTAKGGDVFDWPAYDSWAFHIDENKISLHPRIIRPTRKKLAHLVRRHAIESDGERVGCAGYATFDILHKRIMLVAREAIFSSAEHILSLPLDAPEETLSPTH